MSWDCPFCNRKYPDSGIGKPAAKIADEKTHCAVCAVDPNELVELVEEWRAKKEGEVGGADWALGKCANELEALLDGDTDG
jgi:hypothetical protein